jgi:CheY-like chemotaxis protein
LLGSPLDDRQRECVETLRASGDALLALINDVLDFSKIESGDLELEMNPFDLGTEAEAGLDLVLPAATAKGLELVCDLPHDGSLMVQGDAHRVRQILANLLSNAVKFTERGEIVLRVGTELQPDQRVQVTVSVADTGMGISPAAVERLFRSYSQEDASTTRLFGGSGLGLAISRKLAEAMGGELALASTGADGSTFVLEVVLDRVPPADEAQRIWDSKVEPLAGKAALLVDDNQTNLRILDYQLGMLGLVCTSFVSPAEALQAVTDGLQYDVGVLDMHMPEMDGVTLSAALRELPQVSLAPLVLLTSLGVEPAGLRRSFAAFITKPAKRAVLHETMIRVLSPGRPADGPAAEEEVAARPNRSLHVLLAEDNKVNQRVAKLMLEKLGHSVVSVGNGYEAVDAATRDSFDVVLMDVQMPEVDGLEATRRIRSRLPRDHVPYIVAMTANVFRQDRTECLAAGMHDYLSKPVRIAELQAVLAKAGGDPATVDLAPMDPAEAGPAVDAGVLQALMDDLGEEGGDVRGELIEAYLVEASGYMALLRDVVATADYSLIRAVSHTWRSTSAMLGARRLEELLQNLETSATSATDDCASLSIKVEQEYARVKKVLGTG